MPYLTGRRGAIHHRHWPTLLQPQAIVLLLHGLGEHLGLYDQLALRLTTIGAEVHALDHAGHGHSEGERVLVEDAREVLRQAVARRPGLPVVIVGRT
ncbi:alpha/beta fold hydrolase [Nonomuraea sp. NPDC002799]